MIEHNFMKNLENGMRTSNYCRVIPRLTFSQIEATFIQRDKLINENKELKSKIKELQKSLNGLSEL